MTAQSPDRRDSDLEIISRYTDQPESMPRDLRQRIERRWGGLPVQLYGLADLDASMHFARTWLALGPEHIAVARQAEGAGRSEIKVFDRASITGLREAPGLSCTVLTILGAEGDPALAVLRFTHRQRPAIENIRFVLEEKLAGREVPPGDADAEYIDGLARPIRNAQALVAANELAVLWRLLAYLKPYRRQMTLGMASAAVITLCSLVPPFSRGVPVRRRDWTGAGGPASAGGCDAGCVDCRGGDWTRLPAAATVRLGSLADDGHAGRVRRP